VTLACWAKSDSSTWNANGCLVSLRPGVVIHPNIGTTQVRFFIQTVSNAINATWFPPAGFCITKWHHFAGTVGTTYQTANLYVDGALVLATPCLYPIATTNQQVVFIGRDNYTQDHNRNFIGSIDDARVYDYPLTPAAIQALVGANSTNQLLHLALDDGAGSSIAWNSMPLGGNGALINMNTNTAWTDGVLNGALSFDGVDDKVVTPNIATPSSLTVSCWAKSATANWNASGCLVCERPAFALSPVTGTRNLQFLLYTNATSYMTLAWTAPGGFDITQWHNYAGSFDASSHTATLYVDGYSVASAAATGVNPNTGPIYVGQDSAGGSGHNFSGTVDDVLFYSRALSWNEMVDIAYLTSQSPYFGVAPASPTSFTVHASDGNSIALAWVAGDSLQTGYEIEYRVTGATTWTELAQPAGSDVVYTNTGLQAHTIYDYRIQATNIYGASGFVIASATTPPAAPAGLSPVSGDGQIALSWSASPGATGYNVKCSTNNGGPFTIIATNIAGVAYTNVNLFNGTPYFYVVSALDANGEGTNCSQVVAAPGALSRVGWVASASASAGFTPVANAIDGNVTTRWGTGTAQTNGMWFQVDMGASQFFYQIIMENCALPGDYPRGYQVNVSSDGINWGSPVASGSSTSSVTTISFAPQIARYIRVTTATNFIGGWWSIYEFNVFSSLPSPLQNRDIGNVILPGGASYQNKTFTVQGCGADIHGPNDAFQYVYQPSSADCSIIAKVASVQYVNIWSKAGVMIREATTTGSINAAIVVTPTQGIDFQWRTNTSGTTFDAVQTGLVAPYWVKLTRTGNSFAAYYSADGTAFTQLGSTLTFPMSSSALIGLAVTSHNTNAVCTATFTNVTIVP